MVCYHGICSTSKLILNVLCALVLFIGCDSKNWIFFQANVPSPAVIRGEATQGPNQKPDFQTPAPPTPQAQQPDPHGGFYLLSPTEQFLWSPVGGIPVFILLQQLVGHNQEIYPHMHKEDNTFCHHIFI